MKYDGIIVGGRGHGEGHKGTGMEGHKGDEIYSDFLLLAKSFVLSSLLSTIIWPTVFWLLLDPSQAKSL